MGEEEDRHAPQRVGHAAVSEKRAEQDQYADDGAGHGQSQQSGDALRSNRFTGEMSLRVAAVEPGGRLRVEGTKVINVDKNEEKIELKGWVRSQDVSPGNLVDSWRIADAQIVYTSSGAIAKPKGGIIGKLLGALWP